MHVSGRTLSFPNAHQIGTPSERNDRLGSPFGPLGTEKGLAGLAGFVGAAEQMRGSNNEEKGSGDAYQTGRLAKHARHEQAKEQLTSSQGDKSQSIAQTLEKVFGVSGIKQFSASFSYDFSQTVDHSTSEKLAYSQSSSGRQGINYDYQESYRSVSKTNMAMSGTLTLEDGRSFAFSIDYAMEQSLEQNTHIQYRANNTDSPLSKVINLSEKDKALPVEIAGSTRAFNVLPSEIGNGAYAGIAEHDDNGNGYIDKNDTIWSLLSMGMGGGESSGTLASWRIAIINLIRLELPYISKEEEPQAKDAESIAQIYEQAALPAEGLSPINLMI